MLWRYSIDQAASKFCPNALGTLGKIRADCKSDRPAGAAKHSRPPSMTKGGLRRNLAAGRASRGPVGQPSLRVAAVELPLTACNFALVGHTVEKQKGFERC